MPLSTLKILYCARILTIEKKCCNRSGHFANLQMSRFPALVDIQILANAGDDSGNPVSLSATISSNEPEDGLGDGDMAPDWTEPVIDQDNGIITLQLRAERSGSGDGRVYTITITATDDSGNSSTAIVEIIVPHDKRKK